MKDGKNILPRLKVFLLEGNTITHLEAQRRFGTNRLAEYIRRLRSKPHELEIDCKMIKEGVDTFGRYSIAPKQKVNRIAEQTYSRV